MKPKAIHALLLTAAVGTAAAALPLSGVMQYDTLRVSAADDTNDDWLHAKGSRLYDMNGNEVWLTGANWFGFNCTECSPHYLWSGDINDLVKSVADRGINVLRLPVSTELLYNWMVGDPDPIGAINPNDDPSYRFNVDLIMEDGSVANSQQLFEVLLKKCKQYGIKCFIDIHSPESNNAGHNYGLWYGKSFKGRDGKSVTVTTDVWIETLAWTADHYKNDDTLIGFDLKNEPHSTYGGAPVDAIWDDSNAENNWKKASEDCANAILEKNPNALILIEGVEGYQGHGAWWGGNLRGVKDYPVQPTSGTSQIIYSPHDYGPIVSQQTWFEKNFNMDTLLDDYWRDTWAYLVEEDRYPLLIGEWGGKIPDSVDEKALLAADSSKLTEYEKNVKWLILLRDYMIKHHVNHTFWCLNDDSGDTGGLWKNIIFSGQTGTDVQWDELKYSLFEPSLWQTASSGKYIGLDHQTALGANGISLNEFYTNYASSEGSNLDGGKKSDGKPVTVSGTTASQTTSGTTSETTKTTATTAETTVSTQESVSQTTSATASTSAPNVTTTSGSASQSGKKPLYGDANCSGRVDISDAVLVARIAAEDQTAEVTDEGSVNADVTGDGGITSDDITKILKFLAGLVTDLTPEA